MIARASTLSLLLALIAAPACGDDSGAQSNADARASIDAAPGCSAAGPQALTLTTDDGVELAADLYTTGTVGAPGVILLHMIPPGNTKANFTPTFINALVDRGFNVLNVNRRGAPGSSGTARDAYTGPSGKLDALAAYNVLTQHDCAIPGSAIAIVGASNGTTTMLDFAVFASGDASTEAPAALVFLSGGSYTENQNSVQASLPALGNTAAYLAYPPGEAGWNDGISAIAPTSWAFKSYSPGAHGTGLFASNPEVVADVAAFLEGVL